QVLRGSSSRDRKETHPARSPAPPGTLARQPPLQGLHPHLLGCRSEYRQILLLVIVLLLASFAFRLRSASTSMSMSRKPRIGIRGVPNSQRLDCDCRKITTVLLLSCSRLGPIAPILRY